MYPQMNSYLYQQPIYQQNPQYSINGRIADDFNMISANDVPMSGISVFSKFDMPEIAIKRWNPQGTIQTLLYKGNFESQFNTCY